MVLKMPSYINSNVDNNKYYLLSINDIPKCFGKCSKYTTSLIYFSYHMKKHSKDAHFRDEGTELQKNKFHFQNHLATEHWRKHLKPVTHICLISQNIYSCLLFYTASISWTLEFEMSSKNSRIKL